MRHKKTGYQKFDLTPVILSRLTASEFEYLRLAEINHTGSTGAGGDSVPYGPYIATYMFELPRALEVLGWHRMKMWYQNGQIVVRKRR